jgi:hypothetical protein
LTGSGHAPVAVPRAGTLPCILFRKVAKRGSVVGSRWRVELFGDFVKFYRLCEGNKVKKLPFEIGE